MLNDIMLTGLIGSNPLGALAAFGLLRVCSEIPELSTARLRWSIEQGGAPLHDWIAVLELPKPIDHNGLIKLLIDRQRTLRYEIFDWKDDIRGAKEKKMKKRQQEPSGGNNNDGRDRVSLAEYREKLGELSRKATYSNRLDADYLSALGLMVIGNRSKGSASLVMRATPFRMTSGRQKFFEKIRETCIELHPCPCPKVTGSNRIMLNEFEISHKRTISAFEEALFGPWTYEAQCHSLGLDPAMERIYALRSVDPSPEKKTGVLAAIWLAIEAMPLFPMAISSERPKTTGFISRDDGGKLFVWPIWTKGIGIDTLKTLLMTSELDLDKKHRNILGRRGVAAVYSSVRSDSGSSQSDYAILRPAELVWSL